MMISVKCDEPKDFEDSDQFNTYEGFAHWIADIPAARAGLGAALCALAEIGEFSKGRTGYKIHATSNLCYGYAAKELAREVGLLKSWRGGDRWNKDPQIALEFARRLDKLSSTLIAI